MRAQSVVGMIGAAMIASCALQANAGGLLTTQVVASGLSNPVAVTHAPGDPDRLFILEQAGRVRVVENGSLLATPALDINPLVTGPNFNGDERGLLGIAFHPDFQNNGLLYLNYTGSVAGLGLATVISEYEMTPGTNTINPSSARVLMQIDQPFSNHNGGWIGFGPDGYLYIATGDGGSGNDPGNRAQSGNTLLGKMLRIDPAQDGGSPYTVPADNPFVGVGGTLDEIWATGLRNPFRNSFDRVTGDLWIGDVGQFTREEVNFQPASSTGGENYGWRCREGLIENPSFSGCTASLPPGVVDPIFDYPRSGGNCSVIGGYVYNGCAIPELNGQYIYGDYCRGVVITYDPMTGTSTDQISLGSLTAFGEDFDGEVHVCRVGAGQVVKLIPSHVVDDNMNGVPDSCEQCPADVNGDGMATPADFTAWLGCFNDPNSQPFCDNADVNNSGGIEPADFTAWLAAFNAGCN